MAGFAGLSGWTLLLILLAVAVGIYLWQRKVRSPKQFVEAVRRDVQRLTPEVPEKVQEAIPGMYAGRRKRRYY